MKGENDSLDASVSSVPEIGTGEGAIETEKVEISKSEPIETENSLSVNEMKIETDKIETDSNIVNPDNDLAEKAEAGNKTEAELIKENSEYSDEVNSYIRSKDELDIYQDAGLKEGEVGDKTALTRIDINLEQKDEKGRTNLERMELGLAPLDSNGESLELHHVGQKLDSPIAELTFDQHRGKGNDSILHDKTIESETHAEGTNWDTERQNYWKSRAAGFKEVKENE